MVGCDHKSCGCARLGRKNLQQIEVMLAAGGLGKAALARGNSLAYVAGCSVVGAPSMRGLFSAVIVLALVPALARATPPAQRAPAHAATAPARDELADYE